MSKLSILVGLPLTEARGRVNGDYRVVETAPPFLPRYRIPIWGEPRVLNVQQDGKATVLTVARELLGETVVEKPARTPRQTDMETN